MALNLRIPRTRAGRIALALVVANEIRGLIVVAWILWMTGGRLPGLSMVLFGSH